MDTEDLYKPKIILICGPTGIGKTETAISLASEFNGEIVSADSMQIYRYMDIGTAKPTAEERARVPHHLIDIIAPDVTFDAAQYREASNQAIKSLLGRGILPFVVGGTGFYIRALLYGLCEAIPSNPTVRTRLLSEDAVVGTKTLHERLLACDPKTAAKLHPNDTYRIIRALEVYELTGKPIYFYQQTHRFQQESFRCLKIGLFLDREELYERIDRRVEAMISAGLVAEVRSLLSKGYASSLNALQSIGYRHIADFLEGRTHWDETVRTLKRDTRRYAKRQMTWFGQDKEIQWVEPNRINQIRQMVQAFIK